jgi:hypothetical protein
MAVDRCTDLVGRVNAHSDILDPDIDEGDADRLLSAQLGLDGSEDEIEMTQSLISIISNIIVIRRARHAIHNEHLSFTDSGRNLPATTSECQ